MDSRGRGRRRAGNARRLREATSSTPTTFVLVDAMKRAGSTDPKKYVAQLPGTDYQGVTARIQFQPNGELKNPATTLFSYRGGVKTPIQ